MKMSMDNLTFEVIKEIHTLKYMYLNKDNPKLDTVWGGIAAYCHTRDIDITEEEKLILYDKVVDGLRKIHATFQAGVIYSK